MNEYGNPVSLKPHRGGMLLAFGILGILCCLVFGILAWGTPFAIGPLLAGQLIDGPNPNLLWYACGIVGMLSVLSYLVLHRFHRPAVEVESQPAEASSPA